jgi:pyruvate dehydrogenase E2 component (dihydrolipoamide acetyltransferase)
MEFKLPELGEGVHEGELVKWRVQPGEQVRYDQPLCEVMTDKATMEIPSPFQGRISALRAKEGETLTVGQVLLSFEGEGHPVEPLRPEEPAQEAAPPPQAWAPAPGAPSVPALASPSTRRLARESGVDLANVRGTGPGGRILREDVEKAVPTRRGAQPGTSAQPSVVPEAPKAEGQEERIPLRGLRKRIAERMRLSLDHAAHFTYVEEADATRLVRIKKKAQSLAEARGIRLTYLPFVLKAMVAALKRYPILNSSLDEQRGEIVIKHYFHIGLSVQTPEGLTAPVIRDVDRKSLLELAREIQEVVARARAQKLTREDLQGGTITLTNAGSIGGLFATPVINYPEVAILGFNKISRKVVPRRVRGRERAVIRSWTYFSLSLDHRVVDGAIGAEFMKEFIRFIEDPSLLLLDGLGS